MVCAKGALYVCSTHGVRYIRMVKCVFCVVILYLVKYSHFMSCVALCNIVGRTDHHGV